MVIVQPVESGSYIPIVMPSLEGRVHPLSRVILEVYRPPMGSDNRDGITAGIRSGYSWARAIA